MAFCGQVLLLQHLVQFPQPFLAVLGWVVDAFLAEVVQFRLRFAVEPLREHLLQRRQNWQVLLLQHALLVVRVRELRVLLPVGLQPLAERGQRIRSVEPVDVLDGLQHTLLKRGAILPQKLQDACVRLRRDFLRRLVRTALLLVV